MYAVNIQAGNLWVKRVPFINLTQVSSSATLMLFCKLYARMLLISRIFVDTGI